LLEGVSFILDAHDFELHKRVTSPRWYQTSKPLIGPFPNMHTIIHFEADTITYKEPTIPIELNHHLRKEPSTFHVYYIHHRDAVFFNTNNIQQFLPILHTLNMFKAQT
jgi:hypothetical protein